MHELLERGGDIPGESQYKGKLRLLGCRYENGHTPADLNSVTSDCAVISQSAMCVGVTPILCSPTYVVSRFTVSTSLLSSGKKAQKYLLVTLLLDQVHQFGKRFRVCFFLAETDIGVSDRPLRSCCGSACTFPIKEECTPLGCQRRADQSEIVGARAGLPGTPVSFKEVHPGQECMLLVLVTLACSLDLKRCGNFTSQS
jgi:hypothetical protein